MAPVIVALGNTAPIFGGVAHDEKCVTSAILHDETPDGQPVPLDELIRDVAHLEGNDGGPGAALDGFWASHSAAPAAWVETTRPDLTEALARALGCRIGRPDDWPA